MAKFSTSNPQLHEGKLRVLGCSWYHNQLVLIEHYQMGKVVQGYPGCVEKIFKHLFLK